MECRHGKQIWPGDAPLCAFDENGIFLKNNWNCLLLSELRDIVRENRLWSEEQNCGIIPFDGNFAILSWYKNRGKTEGFWILYADDIKEGTEKDAYKVLRLKDT